MKKFVVASLAVGLWGCGNVDKGTEPVQIVTFDDANNTKSDNNTANNVSANNVSENNVVEPTGLGLLGDLQHTIEAVDLTVIAGSNAGLNIPRDLEFHPQRPTELWIINLGDNSTTVFDNPNTSDQNWTRYAGPGKDHFMARPSSLAFSADNGNFATAQEEDELTQGNLTPENFMGPSLWTSDRAVFDGGHAGHYDMLHNSPNGAGIAWESENRFWVFDGWHQSITMYDFNMDHGPGGSDHSDGEVARYVEGEVSYVGDVPSHLEFDHDQNLLYISDTGNNRIAVLDPTVGEMGQRTTPNYDGGAQYAMNGGLIETWVDGSDAMLELPSGLAIHDGVVFVSDNKLSRIVALDQETGALIDWIDLGEQVPEGGLMGIEIAPDGSLYFVDAVNSQIIRIAAKSGGGPDQ